MKPYATNATRRVRGSLWLTALFVCSGWGAEPLENSLLADDFRIPLWYKSFEVRGGPGYKDNVLLSANEAQGSAFWMSGLEVMIYRLPTHGWQFNFFADATDARYFDSPSVDNEQVVLAAGQLSKDFGHGWKSTVGLNYMFQNQVFDVSTTYTNQFSVGQVRGHTVTPRWSGRKAWGAWWTEIELNGTRQWLDAPLDSYWQFGPRAAAGYGWGRGSEATLSYQWSRLDYDAREQVDEQGAVLPGSSLKLQSHQVELALTQEWGGKRRWQTVTRVSYSADSDNSSGYFDYYYYGIAQQVRYRDDNWEVRAQVRLGAYDYQTQTISASDTAHRRKTAVQASLRAERKLAKHLKVYVSYNWDRSISDLQFDDYEASVVAGGAVVMF